MLDLKLIPGVHAHRNHSQASLKYKLFIVRTRYHVKYVEMCIIYSDLVE